MKGKEGLAVTLSQQQMCTYVRGDTCNGFHPKLTALRISGCADILFWSSFRQVWFWLDKAGAVLALKASCLRSLA